jgi:Tol biopolymer transport system component/DNA-binding winged helix-turn-helix (wHTH) protein
MALVSRSVYSFEGFRVDPQRRLLLRKGETVPLTSKAFELLLALLESDGAEVRKDALMDRVWPDQYVEEANLTVTMSQLRKALGERANEHRLIVTIPGRGYRFVGRLDPPEALIVQQQTVAHLVIEREIASPNGPSLAPPRVRSSRWVWWAAIALVGVGVTVAGVVLYRYFRRSPAVPAFGNVKLTRLTNNGKVVAAAISADGKYFAYVDAQKEGNSLWVQEVGTAGNLRLLGPQPGAFWSLTFTPDGRFLYYTLFFGDRPDLELYRIPFLGGTPTRIPNISPLTLSFSPDGRRFVYPFPNGVKKTNSIMVADADGRNQQQLAVRAQPNTFEIEDQNVSWSADGKFIACVINRFEPGASYQSIVGINAVDGAEISLSPRRWWEVVSVQWLKNGAGLVIAGRDRPYATTRLWLIPYPGGEVRPLTNDVSEYAWISSVGDGNSFVALQSNKVSSIATGPLAAGENDLTEIVSEVGPLNPVVWTVSGEIVFRSVANGEANLWVMNADGSGRRQLTTTGEVRELGISASPDGKQIVFASWISGRSNIWRVDIDGRNLTRLTDGEADAFPRCSPDGRWVVFQRGLASIQRLWRVPLSGGPAQKLSDSQGKWPAISSDGKRIAFFYLTDTQWRIGTMVTDGGVMLESVVNPVSLLGNPIRWAPDGRSIHYISTVGDVSNVWSLPLDGQPPNPITKFTSHRLDDFAWSEDKSRAVFVRTTEVSDVISVSSAP